jgi:proline racemase
MMPGQLRVSVTEYHTAGEPFRIVTGGTGPILGQTILEKHRFARERLDDVRRLVINEPGGHADMCGCWIKAPSAILAPYRAFVCGVPALAVLLGDWIDALAEHRSAREDRRR